MFSHSIFCKSGAAAGALLLINGDIMGYSGIITSSFLHPIKTFEENPWKFTLLASFSWATTVYMHYVDPNCLAANAAGGPSTVAFALAGFLVGFGTKLGNGCTSGHGICGLARFSKRSFTNVLSFMATGIVTTCLLSSIQDNPLRTTEPNPIHPKYGMLFTAATIMAAMPKMSDKKSLGAVVSGALGAFGLAISGMISSVKIENFLNVSALAKDPSQYDPTLACVMGSGVIVSWLSYQFLPNYSKIASPEKCMTKPICTDAFHVPTNTTIDWKLILGGSVFGVGWAIGCFCPGPALFNVAAGSEGAMLYWFPCFLAGAFVAEKLVQYTDSKKKSKMT